jgi:hypothetical protein
VSAPQGLEVPEPLARQAATSPPVLLREPVAIEVLEKPSRRGLAARDATLGERPVQHAGTERAGVLREQLQDGGLDVEVLGTVRRTDQPWPWHVPMRPFGAVRHALLEDPAGRAQSGCSDVINPERSMAVMIATHPGCVKMAQLCTSKRRLAAIHG